MPVVTSAQVLQHAQEHHEADLFLHSHSHEDGNVPHHEHEEDGTPIPADEVEGLIRHAVSNPDKVLSPSLEPAPFESRFSDSTIALDFSHVLANFKNDTPLDLVPSPGNLLPLLI